MEEALGQLTAVVKDLLGYATWGASTNDAVAVLVTSQAVITQLTALQAGYARELNARGFPATQAVSSMTVWLRDALRIPVYAARQLTTLGERLHERPVLADAVLGGGVTISQAQVIGDVLHDLTTDIAARPRAENVDENRADSSSADSSSADSSSADSSSADSRSAEAGKDGPADRVLLEACETALIEHARMLEPAALRSIGSRILAHIAPEMSDRVLKAKLDRGSALIVPAR